jgi:flagellum-specific peptidoglycan hydrolase FlgJ
MKGGKGMRKRNGYAAYRHWRESIRDYKERISSRYQGGDYFAFLRRIGYAEDPAYQRKVMHIVKTSKL